MRNNRYRLKPSEIKWLHRIRDKKVRNVLVIGDLHEPFCLDSYLTFCKEQYIIHDCNQVIYIGDILDNHYSSYHETSADGMGGLDELEYAIKRISRWYKAFPKATVIIGNHDRIIMRKAQTSSIPSKWIKSYKEVLEVPNWEFTERFVQDNVQYIHGENGTARTKAKNDMMNTVQGHLHTQSYTENFVGQRYRIFATQVGCGINHESYAMAYCKYGKKPAIGCAVIKNNGGYSLNLMMDL